MKQLIYFIQKYKFWLYFFFLEFVAILLISNNLSFHRSKLISSATAISGNLFDVRNNFTDYLDLKKTNEQLAEENFQLKNRLAHFKTTYVDTIQPKELKQAEFYYIQGKIRKNSYDTPYNFLTINIGTNDSITKEMAVVNNKGVIGIIDDVTSKYARVQSILNRNSKISAKFKNNNYFGPLEWNGNDYKLVQLTDIPREAEFQVGDTIVTSGRSSIFPENIPIGTVVSEKSKTSLTNSIDVKLFNDMSNIGYIYVIKNNHKAEIDKLEEVSNE